jgi:endonuclease-3
MNKLAADPLKVLTILKQTYPGAKCALDFNSDWQLLVATILSAQCTDVRVNLVTKELFAQYPDVQAIQKMDINVLKELIHSAGFYNQKAKFIKAAAAKVCTEFQGKVPRTMAALITIPGVARKTANVVLSVAMGINEGIAVDTHVTRLANLLGLTENQDPVRIEKDLMQLYPSADWERVSMLLIMHGRNICKARKPDCAHCPLNQICPAAFTKISG